MQPNYLFCVLAWCTLILASCTKEKPPTEPIAIFEFTVNGTLVEWNGRGGGTDVCILCGPGIIRSPISPEGYLSLYSTPPQNAGEGINFTIKATEVNVGTYSDTITTALVDYQESIHGYAATNPYPSIAASATQVGDYATVTITSVKDGTYYDGTFKARLTCRESSITSPCDPGAPKVEIEGEFHNVKAYY